MGKKILTILVTVALLVGCIPVTPELTPEAIELPTSTSGVYPAPYPVSTPLFPAVPPTSETYPQPGETNQAETPAATTYPVPSSPVQEFTPATTSYPVPEFQEQTAYPQPEVSPTAYPLPQTGVNTATAYPGPGEQPEFIQATAYPEPGEQPTQAQPTPSLETPTSPATGELAATPTAFLPEYLGTPKPGELVTISIWHSWSGQQLQVLEQVIQVFQAMEPDVSFDLLYVPFDELQGKYDAAAYKGEGPSLVIGDSDWGAQLSARGLVKDLTPYMSAEFIETLAPPALGAVQVNGRTVALPYAMRGVVLYRNKQLVPSTPDSFDQLLEYTEQATKSGNVGLYLDWGCYFSCAHMQGLGGDWLDDQGQVKFDAGNYQSALDWLEQLQQIQETGALIEFNQDEALNLFKLGKIGITIDGSWRAWSLADAIGAENLAIDTWPINGSTRMAGYVQADALFLNSNTVDDSPAEEQAALRFMGLLLTPEVQLRLAEVGFIPTVMATKPRDEVKAELMGGLNSGVAFPPAWQGEVRQAYWASIDAAVQSVLERGVPARQALENAAAEIRERLRQLENR